MYSATENEGTPEERMELDIKWNKMSQRQKGKDECHVYLGSHVHMHTHAMGGMKIE